jgi:hypothetical protein
MRIRCGSLSLLSNVTEITNVVSSFSPNVSYESLTLLKGSFPHIYVRKPKETRYKTKTCMARLRTNLNHIWSMRFRLKIATSVADPVSGAFFTSRIRDPE